MASEPAIGTKIRRARERLHMSQAELAAEVGVSRSTVNAWERDRAYPQNRIGALEQVLGLSLSEDEGPEPEPQGEDQLDQIEQRLTEMLEIVRRRKRRQGGEPDARFRRTGT